MKLLPSTTSHDWPATFPLADCLNTLGFKRRRRCSSGRSQIAKHLRGMQSAGITGKRTAFFHDTRRRHNEQRRDYVSQMLTLD